LSFSKMLHPAFPSRVQKNRWNTASATARNLSFLFGFPLSVAASARHARCGHRCPNRAANSRPTALTL
jgi:hypothetical protein